MTGTGSPTGLPAELVPLVEDYLACEFVTINRSGTPIAWPTVPLYNRTAGTHPLTTRPPGPFTLPPSIGYPTKAFNIRRNPRVALLFSDPTGSGRRSPP